MSLRKYGVILKKCLKENKLMLYSRLIIEGELMDWLLARENYLYEFAENVREELKMAYPEPKTGEFLVMARYVNFIESCVDDFVVGEIREIV